MAWGTLGSTIDLQGASDRTWTIRFERRLAPRDSAAISNPASSVWLVRDESSSRPYIAKRQALASGVEVDALVDEAAAWRAACLADDSTHVVELVDVFVERVAPHSVTFLAEFCPRGLLPRERLSEPVLLTLFADLAAAAAAIPSPHAHIAYESLLVDAKGHIRLAGFGAHRSAILRDNPGLTPADDAFDIGILVFELVFGRPPSDDLSIPPSSAYSDRLISLVQMAFSHPHPRELCDAAIAAGAEPHAPVVNLDDTATDAGSAPVPEHVARSTERNVERLIEGTDIALTYAALLSDLGADGNAVASSIFKALFKKPVSKHPLCAVRAFTMLHNLMLDGPDDILTSIRQNDKFMAWSESSWTSEAVTTKMQEEEAPESIAFFAKGELSFYAALLRRKGRFHQLAAGGFTGRWERTGTTNTDGRDVLETRRRKVISGMADVAEMTSELGCLFAGATDEEAAAKHAGLGAMVSECCLAFNAALELAHEVHTTRDAQKLTPGIERLYIAARTLVFAVEAVPSAGGEPWVEQFAADGPPDILAEVDIKRRMGDAADNAAEFPKDGWEGVDAGIGGDEEVDGKKKKTKKKKKAKEEEEDAVKEVDADADAQADITAADGAVVVHGADEASKAVTAMFGDLLRMDEGQQPAEAPAPEVRPSTGMSNAQALASAFGVSEDAVTGGYDDSYARNGYSDEEKDGEEGGGYADYQAQQEGQRSNNPRENRGPSTAAWAAKAGYGTRALVISDTAMVKKSHPAFCQCALCQEEEAQAAAQEEAQAAAQEEAVRPGGQYGDGGTDDRRGQDERYDPGDGAYARRPDDAGQRYERDAYDQRDYSNKYKDTDNGDSLDDDGDGEQRPAPGVGNRSYYDDYDSYESIEYTTKEANVAQEIERPPTAAIPLGPASVPNYGGQRGTPAAQGGYDNYVEEWKLDSARVLNAKKLRTGDKISDAELIVVYKGEYNRETVAIKKVTKKGLQSTATISEFQNEVKVTCSFAHTNVVKCIAAGLQNPNLVFVTEWMKRGTLFDVLYKSRIKLNWALIRKMALQIAEGMNHVHDLGYVHCDLKSLNVLTDGGYDVKICDFGLACHVSEIRNVAHDGSGISGTYQYMAPEVLKGEAHTFKSDVYSFAIVMCEMVSGTPPFQGVEARQVAESVVSEDSRPTIPMHCQRAYANVIQKCWATVPSMRPSFSEIAGLIKALQ